MELLETTDETENSKKRNSAVRLRANPLFRGGVINESSEEISDSDDESYVPFSGSEEESEDEYDDSSEDEVINPTFTIEKEVEMRNNAPTANYVVVKHSIDGILKVAKVKNIVLESNEKISTQPFRSAVVSERDSNPDVLPNVALLEGIDIDDDDLITEDDNFATSVQMNTVAMEVLNDSDMK